MENLRTIRDRSRTIDRIIKATSALKMATAMKLVKTSGRNKYAKTASGYLFFMLQKAIRKGMFCDLEVVTDLMAEGPRLLVALFPDQGFCGSFVQSLQYRTIQEGKNADKIIMIGKKVPIIAGADTLKWEARSDIDVSAAQLRSVIVDHWQNHGFRKVVVVGGVIKNALVQKAKVFDLVNFSDTGFFSKSPELELLSKDSGFRSLSDDNAELVEIDGPMSEIIIDLFERYIEKTLTYIVTEHIICELSARTIEMENSVRNAKDMFASLNILYNRTRQTKITQEIIEIVSSAESV
jgi:F-type H+-transporting ATPase subunit gamma